MALAKRYDINPKTVAKWRGRQSVEDCKTGRANPHSTVLSIEEEAIIVAINRTSKFAYVELHEKAGKMIAARFLRNFIKVLPYKIHTILTDNKAFRVYVEAQHEPDNQGSDCQTLLLRQSRPVAQPSR